MYGAEREIDTEIQRKTEIETKRKGSERLKIGREGKREKEREKQKER